VVFDRQNTDRIRIQFDRLPTHAESARMHAQQLADELNAPGAARPGFAAPGGPMAGWPTPTTATPIVERNADPERIREAIARAEQVLGVDLNADGIIGAATGGPTTSPSQPTGGAGGGDEVISRLERLGKLRASGVLTAEEFESRKRKILGES
jgi:putative oligomerization/nucleic acid binding protein